MKKVLVIGLDSAAPELVFTRFKEELPHLQGLMRNGIWGKLESSVPPITVPAWSCMVTGKDPGELGFYGFRNRSNYSYDDLYIANSISIKEDTLWDILSSKNKRVIILGVPQTYPPKPVNGCMISSFLTPSTKSGYTYPPELKKEIEQVTNGYMLDVEGFRTNDKKRLLKEIYLMTDKRFRAARHLMTSREWDFFMLVEMGVDRIHHGFWKYFDPEHIKYKPNSEYKNVIKDYYKYIDEKIGELLTIVNQEDTTVLIVSDHGAKKMDGGICINEWLMQKGYLTLKQKPDGIVPLSKAQIDWENTTVWGEGGYYSRLFLNVKGREPRGTISPSDYEKFREKLITELESLGDEKGNPIGTRVYKPSAIYRVCNGIPPDLIAILGDLHWRSVGSIGYNAVHVFENDTGPDDANHSQHGIFIMSPRKLKPYGINIERIKITDVAPTVLQLMNIEIPPDMQGKVIGAK